MNRLPRGPILVSALVVLLGTCYLFWASPENASRQVLPGFSPAGTLRVATWNLDRSLSQSSGSDSSLIPRVSLALAQLSPHIIAFPALQTEAQAKMLAEALGAGWRWLALPRSDRSGRFLAVLVHPSLAVKDRTLIEAATAGDILAVTVEDELHRSIKILCLMVPGDGLSRDPVALSRIMAWCRKHPDGVTILAGGFNFDPGDLDIMSGGSKRAQNHPRRQLLTGFAELAPAKACDPLDGSKHFDALYISAGKGRVTGGGIPDAPIFKGFSCRPIVADIDLP